MQTILTMLSDVERCAAFYGDAAMVRRATDLKLKIQAQEYSDATVDNLFGALFH